MASSTSMAHIPYSDCCQGFMQYRERFVIGYENKGALSLPSLSSFSIHQRNHKGFLRIKSRPPVVCALQSKSKAAALTIITQKSWDKLVLKNESPVLVEFYASWCGPCQMVHRVIDEVANEYKGKLECFMLNTDNDLSIAEEYDIQAVPVVLLFKNGKKQDCVVGTMPKEFYVSAINKMLAS